MSEGESESRQNLRHVRGERTPPGVTQPFAPCCLGGQGGRITLSGVTHSGGGEGGATVMGGRGRAATVSSSHCKPDAL